MGEAYEEYKVEGSDTPIWLPKPTGHRAVFMQLDIHGLGLFVDIDSIEDAWKMVEAGEPVHIREPFYGEENIITANALKRVLWIKPEYIDHEQIKANAAMQQQQAAAAQAGLSVVRGGRNGRRA